MKKKRKKLTTFGKVIRKKVIEQDITLTELAQRAGTTKQYLNDIIHGRRSGKKYQDKIVSVLQLKQDRSGHYE